MPPKKTPTKADGGDSSAAPAGVTFTNPSGGPAVTLNEGDMRAMVSIMLAQPRPANVDWDTVAKIFGVNSGQGMRVKFSNMISKRGLFFKQNDGSETPAGGEKKAKATLGTKSTGKRKKKVDEDAELEDTPTKPKKGKKASKAEPEVNGDAEDDDELAQVKEEDPDLIANLADNI
jgi:hypothetical protein